MRWLLPLLLTALPLQWIAFGSTPLGPGRVHLLAWAAVAAFAAARLRPRAYLPVLREAWPFLCAVVLTLVLWGLMSLYHGASAPGLLQQVVFLGTAVVVGALFFRTATRSDRSAVRILRWSAGLAGVSLVVGLSLSMLSNGVNPAAVFTQAVTSADPSVVQRELFRSSFSGFGYDQDAARAQFRHEIFAAVLLAMYVSSWASHLEPLGSGRGRALYRLSMVLCVALLLVSMSRAVLIAGLIWPLVGALRSARLGAVSMRQVTVAAVTLLIFVGVVVSGVGAVLWARFTQDTTSYEGRTALYQDAVARLGDHFLTGGADLSDGSSHNFVLDALLRGGVLTALAAAAAMLVLVMLWVGWLARLHREPAWMVPVVAAFALPLDRMLTAGGGLIPPPEWITLFFVFGVLAYRRRLVDVPARVTPTATPATARA